MLPSWRDYQRQTPYYATLIGEPPYDGRVGVIVDTEDLNRALGSYRFGTPVPSQIRAYGYLKDHEVATTLAVLRRVFDEYPAIRESYRDTGDDGIVTTMPPIQSVEQLRDLIGIGNVHILPVERDGHAYIGFDFGCAWDEEHGLGVMVHRERVVAIGQADTASFAWIATDDDGTAIAIPQ